jgi:hypothetical protein
MDADVVRLADALDDLATFLIAHSEPSWGDWIARDAVLVRRGDGRGVTHFLSAFGGMGSLNDLLFDQENGNAASEPEAKALNERFEELRDRAWRQAITLRHAAQA